MHKIFVFYLQCHRGSMSEPGINLRSPDIQYRALTAGYIVSCMTNSFPVFNVCLQYLAEAGWTAEGRVVGVTQPRRVAAVSVSSFLFCYKN